MYVPTMHAVLTSISTANSFTFISSVLSCCNCSSVVIIVSGMSSNEPGNCHTRIAWVNMYKGGERDNRILKNE